MTRLHVTEYHAGTGAGTLVLLHGFPVDSRMWDATASLLDAAWHVIGVDLPGLGGSAHVLPEEPSMSAAADAVHDAISGHTVQRRPLVLAGLSMGGYVTQAYVRAYADDLSAVILLDTRANADSEEARANRVRIADESEQSGRPDAVVGMASGTLSDANVAQRPELVDFLRGLIESQQGSGVAWSQRAMAGRPDSTHTLRDLKVPALVVVGEDDQVSPVDVMTQMAEDIPNALLKVIPDAGHMSPVEQPDVVSQVINDFLVQLR